VTSVREPLACSEAERREFARLVCEGFDPVPETLDGRIADAKWLAFHYVAGGALAAIAAIKAPSEEYRQNVFEKADARVNAGGYRLELGWVFVTPEHRGHYVARRLCRLLLEHVPTSCLFATTRPNNRPMINILHGLGFARVGKPYSRRNEELVVFLRPASSTK
jgi:RimJ/RimL family protein N-acetyltransferase